jgi:hypothetical protein
MHEKFDAKLEYYSHAENELDSPQGTDIMYVGQWFASSLGILIQSMQSCRFYACDGINNTRINLRVDKRRLCRYNAVGFVHSVMPVYNIVYTVNMFRTSAIHSDNADVAQWGSSYMVAENIVGLYLGALSRKQNMLLMAYDVDILVASYIVHVGMQNDSHTLT